MNVITRCVTKAAAGIALALSAATVTSASANTVPPLNLNTDTITVSGLSSGGYMANQFHMAYSDWVKGAGIIAAGPYYCGQNDITTALSQCVNKMETPVKLDKLNAKAKSWAQSGKIASLDNLKDSKVWLLHGTADTRVMSDVSDLLHTQYTTLVPEAQVTYVNNKPFAHVFPTLENGGSCTTSESPFIGACEYDAAGEMLNFMYDSLTVPDDTLSGKVYSFNQGELAGDNAKTLGELGFVYVPKSCEADSKASSSDGANESTSESTDENNNSNACHVHVSFHGCNQYADAVDDAYVTGTGLNRWADDNSMVVIYPQTKKSMFMPLNPQGCWDWWGYTSEDYATREGQQMQAVKSMIEGLSGKGTE